MNPATIFYLLGSFSVFLAERMVHESDVGRYTLDGLGVVLVLASFGTRLGSLKRHPVATRIALQFTALSASSFLFYLLQSKMALEAMAFDHDTEKHVVTALHALIPLVWLVGALPAFSLNRTLAASPHSVHPLRTSAAWEGGLTVAFGLAMLFPLNWLAHETNEQFNFSFFKTTTVGDATRAAVEGLPEPVRVVLFFPTGSEVLTEVQPYFDELEAGNLSVEVMDHAMAPETAKEWKVKDNGNVVLVMGDKVEIIKLGDKLDSAKKDLRKLDGKVQTALLKISKEKRTLYFTVGHDEFYWKNADSDKSNIDFLKKLLESLNFKVKELGIDDGLAQSVPEDAALVFVVGPKKSFFPEEVAALEAFRDQGGALFILLEPDTDDQSALARLGGVSFDGTPVVSDAKYIPLSRGIVDRLNIGTSKFLSHEAVTTLGKHSSEASLITPGTGSIAELEGVPGKVTVTIKGEPDWFRDLDRNYQFDAATEKRGGLSVAAVSEGPKADEATRAWRTAVVADATLASNFFLGRSPANQVFIADTVSWLTSDPSIGGAVESEEDVKIQHTKEGESMWFYGTSILLPSLVFAAGAWRVSSRKKKGAA